MTTTRRAYVPPICPGCGHLLGKTELACPCCRTPRPADAPPPSLPGWLSFDQASALSGRTWNEVVAIVTKHAVPRARYEGRYVISSAEFREALEVSHA